MCWKSAVKIATFLGSEAISRAEDSGDKLLARLILTIHHEADCEYIRQGHCEHWPVMGLHNQYIITTSSPQPLIVHKHSIGAQEAISEDMSYLALFSMFPNYQNVA